MRRLTGATNTNSDPDVSANGRWVVFTSTDPFLSGLEDTNAGSDVFLRDLLTDETTLISIAADGTSTGDNVSLTPRISADGRHVSFTSYAEDLVAGDDGVGQDVFVRDLETGTTTRAPRPEVNLPDQRRISEYADISADGRWLAFESAIGIPNQQGTYNLFSPEIYRWEIGTATSPTLISTAPPPYVGDPFEGSYEPRISGDGSYVTFASNEDELADGDFDDQSDVFLWDASTASVTQVSVAPGEMLGSPYGESNQQNISGDGRYVVFTSDSYYLLGVQPDVEAPTQVWRWDRLATENPLTLVTAAGVDGYGDGDSTTPDVTNDGRFVSFSSAASNLAAADPNGSTVDIFVRDIGVTGTTTLVTRAGIPGADGDSTYSALSASGRFIALASQARTIAPGVDTFPDTEDIYYWDRQGLGAVD